MKSFIAALRNLVLPYGATSGKRIVIDSDDGSIRIYGSNDELFAEMTLGAGTENLAGFISYLVGTGYYAMLGGGRLTLSNTAANGGSYGGNDAPAQLVQRNSGTNDIDPVMLDIDSGYVGTDDSISARMRLTSGGGTTPRPVVSVETDAPPAYNYADFSVSGVMSAGNIRFGEVVISTVANAVTSVTVTYPQMQGSSFAAFVTANSAVPGSQVQEVTTDSPTATSVSVRIYRTTAVDTKVYWMVRGQ